METVENYRVLCTVLMIIIMVLVGVISTILRIHKNKEREQRVLREGIELEADVAIALKDDIIQGLRREIEKLSK